MTESQPPIIVNVPAPPPPSDAGMELIRIVATVLLMGGLGALVWAISQGPMAEEASIVASAAVMFFARQQWRRGVVGTPSIATPTGGATLGQSAANAITTGLARMGATLMLFTAIGVGFAFLFVREAVSKVLTPVVGESTALYASIAVTASTAFVLQHLADRAFGPAVPAERTPIEWRSLPNEDGQQHVWRIGRQLTTNGDGFMRHCPWALLLPPAAAYGVMALGVRQVVTLSMHMFANLVVAGAAAAIVGSFVMMPSLGPRIMKKLRESRRNPEPGSPAAQVVPASPAPPLASDPSPQQAAPSRQVIRLRKDPEPATQTRQTRRIKIKKEQS